MWWKKAVKKLTGIGLILAVMYGIACLLLYKNQERILFLPEKLSQEHRFEFQSDFKEIYLTTHDGLNLHALHFKTEDPKGVIYFLHGNGGSLDGWGIVGDIYTQGQYDVFIPDYRGYGKSEGSYENVQDLFMDVETGYNYLKAIYGEEHINVFGYSLGTGLAAHLASAHHPARLVLHAPYYSMKDMMQCRFPMIPTALLKYDIRTFAYLKETKAPIYIFHGTDDRVIPVSQTKKIMASTTRPISFYTIPNQGHTGMIENYNYLALIGEIMK